MRLFKIQFIQALAKSRSFVPVTKSQHERKLVMEIAFALGRTKGRGCGLQAIGLTLGALSFSRDND